MARALHQARRSAVAKAPRQARGLAFAQEIRARLEFRVGEREQRRRLPPPAFEIRDPDGALLIEPSRAAARRLRGESARASRSRAARLLPASPARRARADSPWPGIFRPGDRARSAEHPSGAAAAAPGRAPGRGPGCAASRHSLRSRGCGDRRRWRACRNSAARWKIPPRRRNAATCAWPAPSVTRRPFYANRR